MSNLQQLNKLKAELRELLANKPHLYATSIEDVDDCYQAKLEWQWEVEGLRQQIKELEGL